MDAIDVLGPLPITDGGNRYLLIAADRLLNFHKVDRGLSSTKPGGCNSGRIPSEGICVPFW